MYENYPQRYNKTVNQEQEKNSQFYEEEIDLMDYMKVLLKRKRLVLGVFLIAVVIAGIYSWLAPKVYKIEASFEVGWIGWLIEAPVQVVEKIKNGVYGGFPKVKAENPVDTNLIEIEIDSKDPQKGKEILENIIESIQAEHNDYRLNIRKESLERKITRLQEKIDFLLKTSKEQEVAPLLLEKNNLQEELAGGLFPTKVIKEPTISEKPIRPKPLLNIVIAVILGLFIGVFLAFGKEWWEKVNPWKESA